MPKLTFIPSWLKSLIYQLMIGGGVVFFCYIFFLGAPTSAIDPGGESSSSLSFSYSLKTGEPVKQLVLAAVPRTLAICLMSITICIFLSFLLALFLSLKRSSLRVNLLKNGLVVLSYFFASIPLFFAGYLIVLLSLKLFNFYPLPTTSAVFSQASAYLYYIAPILTLALFNGEINEISHYLYQSLQYHLKTDYIRTARAKGVSLFKHLLPLGILSPIVSVFAAKVPIFLSQSVVIEAIYNFNGAGYLAWRSAQNRDFPVIFGMIVFYAVFIRLINIAKVYLQQYLYPPARDGQ